MTAARICDACEQPLTIPWRDRGGCVIDTCTTPPTVHVTGYPDCVDLCPEHDRMLGVDRDPWEEAIPLTAIYEDGTP